ncbi:MAG: MnhB domain-containing protein [Acidimicrobiia bacterium]|jgi:multisubunit Na+/H+ antiporter MnhB subunit
MTNRSLILDTTVRLIFDAVLVFSVYLLFAGHNQPGGGFVGGLVAAGAVALRYLAGGLDEVRRIFRLRPWTFLSLGLGIAVLTALVPVVLGDPPLDQEAIELQLGFLGTAKATSATLFDTGVYLIVVGLVLMAFEGLGEETVVEPRDLGEGGS